MASRKGFEPLTPGLGNLCSILLSYRDMFVFNGLRLHPTVNFALFCSLLSTGAFYRRFDGVQDSICEIEKALHNGVPFFLERDLVVQLP